VIGEIRGSLYPEEIITVGGHLDAWDTGEGAHDDGAGCIQAIEVLRLYKSMGIEPKRTIRAVMFMDEEISQSGAKVYFNEAKRKNEKHYMAMESDRGALVPRSVAFTAPEERMNALMDLERYFKPYSLENFKRGGGGPDVGRLTELGAIMVAYLPDVQRYFDFHHSANDAFEEVHFRELQLGSAAMASIIYLIDFLDL
jgi:Zn-dependent M28 family amino/carboxypeptidase